MAAAIQTVLEVGDADAVTAAVNTAFPGASVNIVVEPDSRFAIEFQQLGLLRRLSGAELSELSDGTLRFLL